MTADSNRTRHWFRRPLALAIVAAAVAVFMFLPKTERAYPSEQIYGVRGIDLSAHNGEVDFAAVKDAGIEFVALKATEGASFKDARFARNYRGAVNAGLKVGAYHFFRFDANGTVQAMNLLHSIGTRRLDLPLMIDVEEWTNPDNVTTDAVLAGLDQMVTCLQGYGYRVILYTNKAGHRRFLRDRFSDLPLWICSFTDPPTKGDWHLWQYDHHGSVAGVKGGVDMNVFNGSHEDWERWLKPADADSIQ